MKAEITTARAGDIVRFKSYALRVETAVLTPNYIDLRGRISINGCPMVTKRFLHGQFATIERKA